MKNLYIGEDNLLEIEDVEDAATGEPIDNATVSFQLKDTAGENVGSAVSASYVAANPAGNPSYQGTLPKATAALLVEKREYHLWVTINSQAGYRRVRCIAVYHDED